MLCILEYIQSEDQVQNTKKAFLTTLMDKVYDHVFLLVGLKTLVTLSYSLRLQADCTVEARSSLALCHISKA